MFAARLVVLSLARNANWLRASREPPLIVTVA
jgi:hypothetical protein